MTGEIVRFPTRRRALDQLGLDRPPDEEALATVDAEIRCIDKAIEALRGRKAGLLVTYGALLAKAVEAQRS